MDNQATKYIKKILTKNDCKLQVVKPHNHWVNVAECVIQTFKAAFIAALATMDSNFSLQLWDRLNLQVQDTLNLLRASWIDPTKSAYEILNGQYDWNRYPLAPHGCKAVVYEDGDTRGLWESRSVDAFYLGPAIDHYQCDHYYIPKTWAYRISGSSELFPRHCQLPLLTPHQHLRALTDELTDNTELASATPKGRRLLRLLATRINGLLTLPPTREQQRVTEGEQHKAEQRVIDESLIKPYLVSLMHHPSCKSPHHTQQYPGNTLGSMCHQASPYNWAHQSPQGQKGCSANKSAASLRGAIDENSRSKWRMPVHRSAAHHQRPYSLQTGLIQHNSHTVLPHATHEGSHQLQALRKPHGPPHHQVNNFQLQKVDAWSGVAEVWQTAFEKDFGGMAQGCNKTGQKGMNTMHEHNVCDDAWWHQACACS